MSKKTTLRLIIVQLQNIKNKEKVLKEARELKHLTYRGAETGITPDFSLEAMWARGQCGKLLKCWEKKTLPAENSGPWKTILQKRKKNEDCLRPTKIEGIY